MLKTFIIDGDKGGVGKSMAARALIHHYLARDDSTRPKIVVIDADCSNPDVCGTGGIRVGSGIIQASLVDLSTEDGWIDFGTLVGRFSEIGKNIDLRIVVNMPAQIGTRAFDGSIPIVNEVLREANAIPVWMLSRTHESIRALEYRLENMGPRYQYGVAIKNLFFGQTDKFGIWEASPLHQKLVVEGEWLGAELPELNDQLAVKIGRTPFHEVLSTGIDGKPLEFGYRLALNSWLQKAGAAMARVEEVEVA
ncbi:protein MobD [mine drainage metagenome]|uniref:Protein MobD n=1 Tax=mine drainage metagenome TaxID=410659 RepID=T0ZAQ5_9ZZZZ